VVENDGDLKEMLKIAQQVEAQVLLKKARGH
jgi:hypothetical protein